MTRTDTPTDRYPAYPDTRPSGIAWLGDIPAHWEIRRLKHLGESIIGLTYSPSDIADKASGILVLRASNIQNRKLTYTDTVFVDTIIPERLLTRAGDIVICSRSGSRDLIGKNAMITEKDEGVSFGAFMTVFRSPYNIFLSHVFNSNLFKEQSGSFMTSTINQLTISILNDIRVTLPPPDEQRAIAAFLDRETAKIDALIAAKQRFIALLGEKRSAVISHAVTKGLDPDAPMKDSGVEWLGEIPAHWNVQRLATAAKQMTNGYVGPTRDILVDEGVRYLQSLHIKNGRIKFDRKHYFVTEEWSLAHSKSILREGDLLIVQTGDIGQVCAVPAEFVGVNCHALIIVRLRDPRNSGFYLSLYLRSDVGQNELLRAQTGALHPHLEIGKVREISIPFPPANEQQEILVFVNAETEHMDSLIAKTRETIVLLQEQRAALISAAVTGKIDIRGVV
jgi:type I restriction enzyme, S subunit